MIEEQHPIPQQISSYQFKLVGDMTLKQFFQVAAGAIVSLILYSTNLNPAIKWPLIIGSFLVGVAFAFFPVQDRPLSKWITLFIQAVYSPTIFMWKKNYVKPNYFAPEPSADLHVAPLPTGNEEKVPTTTTNTPTKNRVVEPKKAVEEAQSRKEPDLINTEAVKAGQRTGADIFPNKVGKGEKLIIPQAAGVGVDIGAKTQTGEQEISSASTNFAPTPIASHDNYAKGIAAQFSATAAPPEPPEYPNIIVGQTVSNSGGIIDNTILEIKDSDGRPVRALKSNKLGHFMIVTPLPNGNYQMVGEKDGFVFEPVNITLKGETIEPIIIKAKEMITL